MTSGSSWNESNFDLKKWLFAEPAFVFEVLLNHYLTMCPVVSSNQLCLKYGSIYVYDEFMDSDINYILNNLQKLDNELKREAGNNYLEFLLLKKKTKSTVLGF